MNIGHHRRANEVFDELGELASDARNLRLAELRRSEPEVSRIVGDLFAAERAEAPTVRSQLFNSEFTLSHAWIDAGDEPDSGAQRELPPEIGVFRVIEWIGSGGMGEVFRAHQRHPNREVALKIARGRTLTPALLRQFELEADALGRLQHPGIALIHDAGTARFGSGEVPYLVMQLVRGVDMSTYVAAQSLDRRGRIELLVRVCRAISHAHKCDVVHRDLKPQNILVEDGGDPKIVDFGLACFASAEASLGGGVGTLPYMSPEQARGDGGGNGFQTDVYSLGAIAFELLTGKPPIELPGALDRRAALRHVAEAKRPAVRELAPDVDRDLGAIVDRALACGLDERYRTVAAFTHDLELWLDHRPVSAREASSFQRAKQFMQRNRVGVLAATLLVVSLCAGLASTIVQARAARAETQRVYGIRDYLSEVLRSTGEPRTDGVELPISHALDRAAERLGEAFRDDPRTRAELSDTLGMAYFENGRLEEGERLVREAYDWRRLALGQGDADTLASCRNLGIVLYTTREVLEAEELMEAAYGGAVGRYGREDPVTISCAVWLGHIRRRRGADDKAEALYRAALDARMDQLGAGHHLTQSVLQSLAALWREQSRLQEAEDALRSVLAHAASGTAGANVERARCEFELGLVLTEAGRPTEAEAALVSALGELERLRGVDHPECIVARANLDTIRASFAELKGGAAGPKDPAASPEKKPLGLLGRVIHINSAGLALRAADFERAEEQIRIAIESLVDAAGHEYLLRDARLILATVLSKTERLPESIVLLESVLRGMDEAGQVETIKYLWYQSTLADFLRRDGQLDRAVALIGPTWEAMQNRPKNAGIYRIQCQSAYASILAESGDTAAALANLDEVRAIVDASFSKTDLPIGVGFRRAQVMIHAGRFLDAREELDGATQIALERHGERSVFTLIAADLERQLAEGVPGLGAAIGK